MHQLTDLCAGNAFLHLPLDEKRKHPCNFAEGNFFGFREGFRIMGNSGVKDNSEACVCHSPTSSERTNASPRSLCLPKIVPSLAHEFPAYDFLQPFKPEIESFQRKVHERVLDPLLRLFALLLELPEEYFAAVRLALSPSSQPWADVEEGRPMRGTVRRRITCAICATFLTRARWTKSCRTSSTSTVIRASRLTSCERDWC